MFLFLVLKIQNIGEITNFFRLSYPELTFYYLCTRIEVTLDAPISHS